MRLNRSPRPNPNLYTLSLKKLLLDCFYAYLDGVSSPSLSLALQSMAASLSRDMIAAGSPMRCVMICELLLVRLESPTD